MKTEVPVRAQSSESVSCLLLAPRGRGDRLRPALPRLLPPSLPLRCSLRRCLTRSSGEAELFRPRCCLLGLFSSPPAGDEWLSRRLAPVCREDDGWGSEGGGGGCLFLKTHTQKARSAAARGGKAGSWKEQERGPFSLAALPKDRPGNPGSPLCRQPAFKLSW